MANYAFIRSKLNSNVIDIQQESTKAGAPLDAYPQKPSNDNQLWQILPDPSGYSFIRSKLNGYVIDIVQAFTKPGALLDAYPQKSTGNDNQLWKLIPDGNSGYSFIQSKLNGNVIDIVQASVEAGALLDAYPQKPTGNANQLWRIVPENPLFPPPIGFAYIQSQLNGYVIDILGGSTKPGASLDAWPKQDVDNQLWAFSLDPAGSGYFFISSKMNFNVIDIEQASKQPGALLDAYPQKPNGNDNQLWKFVSDGSGWGFLESKLNGNVIDIQQASVQPGAPLDAYPRKSSAIENQLWMPVGATFPELPTSLTFSNLGTGSGTTSSGATECSYTLNLTIQQDGTCRFWGTYTNRGDLPIITAPSQTFGVAIVVLDVNGNGYSFGTGSKVPSAPQAGSTYSWDKTEKSSAIADNWTSIATRNWADYSYHNQASVSDVLSEIEGAVSAATSAIATGVKVVMAIVALVA